MCAVALQYCTRGTVRLVGPYTQHWTDPKNDSSVIAFATWLTFPRVQHFCGDRARVLMLHGPLPSWSVPAQQVCGSYRIAADRGGDDIFVMFFVGSTITVVVETRNEARFHKHGVTL